MCGDLPTEESMQCLSARLLWRQAISAGRSKNCSLPYDRITIMQVRVKICGITNPDDAQAAVDFGADALGFVFFEQSPRCITHDNASSIIRRLPSFITTVGVFVDEKPEQIEKIASWTGIDVIQLQGEEPPAMCYYSKRIITP